METNSITLFLFLQEMGARGFNCDTSSTVRLEHIGLLPVAPVKWSISKDQSTWGVLARVLQRNRT